MNGLTTTTIDAAVPATAVTEASQAKAKPRATKPRAATGKGKATKATGLAKKAPKAAPTPLKPEPARPAKAVTSKGPRGGSTTEKILALLKRANGASLKELMKATGWQAHSVRGFLSSVVGKKMGLTVQSVKGKDGGRVYSV